MKEERFQELSALGHERLVAEVSFAERGAWLDERHARKVAAVAAARKAAATAAPREPSARVENPYAGRRTRGGPTSYGGGVEVWDD